MTLKLSDDVVEKKIIKNLEVTLDGIRRIFVPEEEAQKAFTAGREQGLREALESLPEKENCTCVCHAIIKDCDHC